MDTQNLYSEQGDYCLNLSPFGGLYSFKIFTKESGVSESVYKNINLDNTDIELNFFDGKDEINIKSTNDIEGYSLNDGYVVFNISKEDAQKALKMETKKFYLTQNVGGYNNTIFEGYFGEAGERLSTLYNDLLNKYNQLLNEIEASNASNAVSVDALQSELDAMTAKYDLANKNYLALLEEYNKLKSSAISANIVEELN